jgi:hypothetical protein
MFGKRLLPSLKWPGQGQSIRPLHSVGPLREGVSDVDREGHGAEGGGAEGGGAEPAVAAGQPGAQPLHPELHGPPSGAPRWRCGALAPLSSLLSAALPFCFGAMLQ